MLPQPELLLETPENPGARPKSEEERIEPGTVEL
jgi:hypothetical protein